MSLAYERDGKTWDVVPMEDADGPLLQVHSLAMTEHPVSHFPATLRNAEGAWEFSGAYSNAGRPWKTYRCGTKKSHWVAAYRLSKAAKARPETIGLATDSSPGWSRYLCSWHVLNRGDSIVGDPFIDVRRVKDFEFPSQVSFEGSDWIFYGNVPDANSGEVLGRYFRLVAEPEAKPEPEPKPFPPLMIVARESDPLCDTARVRDLVEKQLATGRPAITIGSPVHVLQFVDGRWERLV